MSIILFIGGGVALDRVTDLSPLFTLTGVALALAAAGYQLYELTRVGRVDREPGPLTRQISRLPVQRRGTQSAGRSGEQGDRPGEQGEEE